MPVAEFQMTNIILLFIVFPAFVKQMQESFCHILIRNHYDYTIYRIFTVTKSVFYFSIIYIFIQIGDVDSENFCDIRDQTAPYIAYSY